MIKISAGGFPDGPVVKNLPANAADTGSIPQGTQIQSLLWEVSPCHGAAGPVPPS